MLRLLRAKIEEGEGQLKPLWKTDVHELGREIGLNPRRAERIFIRLLVEGYVRARPQRDGRLYFGADQEPFLGAAVEDLTDKGLREVGALPPEAAVEGLLAALEEHLRRLEEDPDLSPPEKERQRTVLRRMRDVVRDTAVEVGPKLLVEVLTKGMSGWA